MMGQAKGRAATATATGGMRSFLVVWAGQLISLVGTAMTRFAITIWAYQETGSATALALVAVFAFGPSVLLSPVAGALVDRWSRKAIMLAADAVAGITTVALLALYSAGGLEVWHLYVAGAVGGAFDAFQFPAFSAAVTTMVDRRHYARASGLMSMAGAISAIAAPAMAGAVLAFGDLEAVLALDVATFVIAVALLALVRIPPPVETEAGRAARGSLRADVLYGFRYIGARPGLLGLLLVFFQANLFLAASMVLMAPMVLARSGNDELALGAVQSAAGVGGLVGGLLLATWGGPKKRIHGVLLGMALGSLAGPVLIGLGDSVAWWAAGSFGMLLFMPVLNGSSQAIWQAKVEPDVQGRVFAARRLIAQIAAPVAMLAAGPLADRVAEPAMAAGGALEPWLGPVLGTGPGSGMALIFVATGLLGAIGALSGYLVPVVRNVERDLPDHEQAGEGAPRPATERSTAERRVAKRDGWERPQPSVQGQGRLRPAWMRDPRSAFQLAVLATGLLLALWASWWSLLPPGGGA